METDDVPGGAPNADTAARVREVIAAAGVSQREFARRVVMDPSKLSRSLSGTRRFTVAELARIADEGRIDAGRLLGTRSREKATPPAAHVEGGRPLQIVRETVRLIAEHGFHAVRVADIARACATSSAAIHYHFPGRAELLEAAVRWCMDEDTARRAARLAEADDAAAELSQLIALQTPRTAQQRRQWAVWLDLWAEAARSTTVGRLHSEYYRQWRETVADVVRRGVGQGVFRAGLDPQAAALTLTALIDGLATHVLSVDGTASAGAADAMHAALTTHVNDTILAP
ncbi:MULTISPECIES: TetR/AcrR family transcriptional regulator [Streptomyces]|uniref:TetR-family transcriptional regulator n=1 Tax=Streptomyces coelicolor (strain ATCC BAA-471 / A3(2) / M145) TaxID=100226 RepID=Q8CJN5_STRCO|nr:MULTISPECIES: TetR/AcrR family transcriptional regulator [Streptomyces]MYU45818.1 TetR family transcriptional regulator [Streptomyces sp. SID7813]MDX2929898.1 TetR family transcriptional regulator C-terminal domain-containing protein [Streptomyces sp. NRRL_B-16638]MDX3404719.1 TetR family transcriptional regulator C-terminal domain-containing protein [Streptomyces sp. ME02-6977A]NSL81259.1 TetR family transcriptional regulator [Streptomyces coelicolor]QFI46123.1 TetR family transcriptional 